ncbi:MAG: ImmA/IrrE family metallo-endopeptidase [Gammaproteobacteria bacterium]|nr:ImmA/IrrE family metallo-endopeptidase [Gammaproteobacteria bacterium]
MKRKRKPDIWISPPRLSWSFIQEKAEEFRSRYVGSVHSIPVPIIEIVELTFKLEPIPIRGLMERIDIDSFLTKDLKNICIDNDLYMDPRRENRLRFSYAHEIGHLILHENEIKKTTFSTPEDWIRFREDFLEDDLNWFESQANEFAGRLLVPRESLIEEIQGLQKKIKEFRAMAGDEEESLIEAISGVICNKYEVSRDVIQRRIRIEKLKI